MSPHSACNPLLLCGILAFVLVYRSNVTFYMKDDDGRPLLADDIIPILTSEVALGFNDDNPYNLLNAEKGHYMLIGISF